MPLIRQLRERAQREHNPKADLECNVILYCAPQINALDIALQFPVRDQVYSIAFSSLHASDEEADDEHK